MEQERGRVKDAKRRLMQRLDRMVARAEDGIRNGRDPEDYIQAIGAAVPKMLAKEQEQVSRIMVGPLTVWLEEEAKARSMELRRFAKGKRA